MSKGNNYRKVFGIVATALFVLLSPVAASAATSGSGSVSVTPKAVQPSSNHSYVFAFSASNSGTAYATGSALALTIPATFSAPQTSNSTAEGYVTVAETGSGTNVCNPGTIAVTGSGPWVITVPQTCGTGDAMSITYGAGTSATKVLAPAVAGISTFTTQTRNATSSLVNLSSQPTVTVDGTAPTLAQVTPVASTTTDTTPSYTFSSTETGTISYAGGCSGSDTSASVGNNVISFSGLSYGVHSTCTIKVTDAAGNQSALLAVSPFTLIGPDLIAVLTNDLSGGNATIAAPFHWTIVVSNIGSTTASFGSSDTVLTDSLPTTGATYAISATSTSVGVTGKMVCSIASSTLTCSTTSGTGSLGIPAGASVTVVITATPTANGNLVNPRVSGSCKVDSSTNVSETNENNNTCANTVTVASAAVPAVTLTPSTLSNGTVGTSYTQTLTASTSATSPFTWTIASGTLPLGLSLSTSTGSTNSISGMPTASGTSIFAIGVTNGVSSTTQSYTMTIDPAAVVPQFATVHVVTNVINDNGGTNSPSNFGIYMSGASSSPLSFSGSNVGTNVTVNAGEAYSVSVPTLTYSAAFSPDCISTLTAGDIVTCTITLDDLAPLPSGQNPQNLIANPLLENPSSGNANIPNQWNKGFDDAGTAVTYVYPATNTPDSDISSGNAARIVATGFATGTDAKWYFNPVSVIPGQQYAFSDSYISAVPTDLVAAFCTDAFLNGCSYGFATAPATPANTWKQASAVFTIPLGKSYMTVFHRINVADILTVDNYSLTLVPPPAPFANGFVTLSFDDSLVSQYDNARTALSAGNVHATFYAITHFISGFSIANASLENGTTQPTGWSHSGSSATTTTYDYPSDPHTGAKGARVSSSISGSNAAWYFNPVTILPDGIYSFSEWYKSTAASELVAQITLNDGTVKTADVTTVSGTYLSATLALPASATYVQTHAYFYVPANTKSITVLNRLKGIGELTIDDVSLGLNGYMTAAQILALQADGHEVGGHTQTHANLSTVSTDVLSDEVSGGRQDLLSNALTPATSFAYPYGAYNQSAQQEVEGAGYSSGRTVTPGFNGKTTPKYALLSESVNADTSLTQVDAWLDEAKADKTWLILTFHDVQSNLTNLPYGTTPTTLQAIIDHINQKQVQTKTIAQGVALMNISTVNVVTAVNNTHGGTASSSDFTISVTGANASPNSFTGSIIGTAVAIDANQSYTVAVASVIPSNYTASYSSACAGTVTQGNSVTCTVTLSDIAVNIDPIAPVVTITGTNPVTLEAGSAYVEEGASSTDNLDGDISAGIVITNPVNIHAVGNYSVSYDSTDAHGNHATTAVRTVNVIDTTLPELSLGGPSNATNDATPTFTFSATDATAFVFTCNVDGAGFTPCASPFTTQTLADGAHTVAVRVVDQGGNTTTGNAAFTVDTAGPSVNFTIQPASPTNVNSATFAFTIGDANGVTCTLDSVAIANCASPVTVDSLANGAHQFVVTAHDELLNSSSASVLFTVDIVAPHLTVNSQTTNSGTPTIIGTSDDAAAVSVTVNTKTYITTPVLGIWTTTIPAEDTLIDGTYSITVTSTDLAGNIGSANGTVTVNTVAPNLAINSVAANSTTITGTTDVGATVDVTINSVTAAATVTDTTWSVTVPALADGTYVITAHATDALSNVAEKTASLVIDTTAPTIDAHATVTTEATTVSGATVTYALPSVHDNVDSNLIATCAPVSGSLFAVGNTTVTCGAIDLTGHNATASTFTVAVTDTTAPVITLVGGATTTVAVGTTYTDLGATASDIVDGDIATTSIVITGDTPTTTVPATFHIIYNVADAHGNHATPVTRTVVVSNLAISTEGSTSVGANSITVTWTTSHPATSRVVFDTVSHTDASSTAAGAPNYGYANSTTEDSTLVLNHSVAVSGLSASTAYFFRSVSHGSPEVFGNEVAVTTTAPAPVTPPSSGGGGGGGGGGGSSYIYGCTDKLATNYYSFATVNNGSCKYAATTTPATSTVVTTTASGEVLGASTTCSDLLTQNLRVGSAGSEVKKLQDFLIAQGFLAAGNNSGTFGPMTKAAVSAFQLKYKAEILTPNGLTLPTGSVLSSTRAVINKIACSGV